MRKKYSLEIENNEMVLSIFEQELGKNDLLREISTELRGLGVEDIPTEDIESIMDQEDKTGVIISDAAWMIRDASLELIKGDNGLYADARVIESNRWGTPLTVDDIMQALKRDSIVYGIKEDLFEDIVATQQEGRVFRIAEGINATQGADAYLEYIVDLEKLTGKPTFREDGSVDMRKLNNILQVHKEQILVKRSPPVEGEDGIDIYGRPIYPKKVEDVNLPQGKNTYINEDNTVLLSAIDGQAHLDGRKKLAVNAVVKISGDVDYGQGDVDFIGDVIISGDVKAGFTVKSEGNVKISGVVNAATVIAQGDVIVSGGILGRNQGIVKAGKDIYAKFLENVKAEAQNDIIVGSGIMHSDVAAGNIVNVTSSKRAKVSGGTVRAGSKIKLINCGSSMGTKTLLEVGVSPFSKKHYELLNIELSEVEKRLTQVNASVSTLKKLEEANSLDEKKSQIFEKLLLAQSQLIGQKEGLDAQIEQLVEVVENCDPKYARVEVEGVIEPGCEIYMGVEGRTIREKLQRVRFYLSEHREVTFESLN